MGKKTSVKSLSWLSHHLAVVFFCLLFFFFNSVTSNQGSKFCAVGMNKSLPVLSSSQVSLYFRTLYLPSENQVHLSQFSLNMSNVWYPFKQKELLNSSSITKLFTAAHQAPPFLGFSRLEYWSGLPFPSPMHESEK